MLERRVYHVRRGRDNSWMVIREGFQRPHMVRETKEEAVIMAKRLAKVRQPGQVIIHALDDEVERRYSYSVDSLELG